MARVARIAGRGRNARLANVDLNRDLVGADARDATGDRVRDFRRDEFAAGDFALELNRFHDRRFDATGANFRNHLANFVVHGLVNRFRDDFANFIVDGADALFRNHLADGVVANFRFRNHLAGLVVHGAHAGLRNHLADGVVADASFRNHLANFVGNRADALLRNHTDALDFLHNGLRNPNFAFAGRRRALDLADLVFDRAARVARIAARDAAKDRFARNRNGFGLPAAGLNRNLFHVGLRNANGVRNLFLAFNPSRLANGVLTLTLFVDRFADGVRNLLLAGFVNRFADGVLTLTLFVNRFANGVRDLLLTRVPNRLADGVLTLTLFVDRFADGVRDLLLAGFPNRLADGVLTLALFVNRFANGVRNLLLAVLPNRAVHRAGDRLLTVFPNRAANGVLNFANASFRNVFRAKNAARDRNFLEGRPVANDLLLLVHDFAAGLHHRAALRREFARARSAPTIRRRAAPSALRLFKRRSQQSRREQ